MIVLPPQVNTVITDLEQAGFEAYLVGGAVRDYVRDCTAANDWDIASNAVPEQVKQVFAGYNLIETGLKHGTVTVVIDQEPIEITTYRIDGKYLDGRHPDTVSFTRSLEEDLGRRDFTINALAYNPHTGIVDFNEGVLDIENGVVRCVGDPDQRFQEDGLRILRALRFASNFGMRIEEKTAEAIHRNKGLLRTIAVERIQVELSKMLCGSGAYVVLQEFADVIAIPIPEIEPMFGFDQYNPHHDRDIWNHTISVINSIAADPILRWAAFLHDIGKPLCFTMSDDGIGHFYGHAKQSAIIAERILLRLRFDNASKEQIKVLVRYHDLPIAPEKKSVKRLMSKLGAGTVKQILDLHIADTKGQSTICMGRIEEYYEAGQLLDDILQEATCFSLKELAINGTDLICLGLRGREIGTALDQCLLAVIDERVINNHSALMDYARSEFIPQVE